MPRQMLIRQNQPPPVQPAAVIDKVVVDCRKHIDIELSQLERHQALAALVCLVKINARALRKLIRYLVQVPDIRILLRFPRFQVTLRQ